MIDNPLLGLSQRLAPSNTQAEQALLGALLANNLACQRVEAFLLPKHFADPVHGDIFDAIMQRWRKGCLVDAVSLRAVYQDTGVLDEVGGTAYLGQLLTAMVGIIDPGEYGRAIHDAWLRRQLIDIGETVVNAAVGANPEMDGREQVTDAMRRLHEIAPAVQTEDLTPDRQIFGHMRGLCRTAAAYLDTALRFGIADGQRMPFENLRDRLREVEPIAAKSLSEIILFPDKAFAPSVEWRRA